MLLAAVRIQPPRRFRDLCRRAADRAPPVGLAGITDRPTHARRGRQQHRRSSSTTCGRHAARRARSVDVPCCGMAVAWLWHGCGMAVAWLWHGCVVNGHDWQGVWGRHAPTGSGVPARPCVRLVRGKARWGADLGVTHAVPPHIHERTHHDTRGRTAVISRCHVLPPCGL